MLQAHQYHQAGGSQQAGGKARLSFPSTLSDLARAGEGCQSHSVQPRQRLLSPAHKQSHVACFFKKEGNLCFQVKVADSLNTLNFNLLSLTKHRVGKRNGNHKPKQKLSASPLPHRATLPLEMGPKNSNPKFSAKASSCPKRVCELGI